MPRANLMNSGVDRIVPRVERGSGLEATGAKVGLGIVIVGWAGQLHMVQN